MWLTLSLVSVLLFSTIFVIDEYCVENIFDKAWIGFVTSALTSGLVLAITLPFAAPFISWNSLNWNIVLIGFTAGSAIQLSQLFYFQSLSWSESDTVAAFGSLTPILLPIIRFSILGEKLPMIHYVGIATLVTASAGFYVLDLNFKTKIRALVLMIASCLFLVTAFSLEDILYTKTDFVTGFISTGVGITVIGCLPLFLKRNRIVVTKIFSNVKNMHLLVVTEVLNIAAIGFWAGAISIGNPSYVAAVEATIPGFTYTLAATASICRKKATSSSYSVRIFSFKWALVSMMILGIVLLQS